MTEIKVGDVVSYQEPSYTNDDGSSFQPMGLRGCTVVALVGDGVAILSWYHPFIDNERAKEFVAELSCIHPETGSKTIIDKRTGAPVTKETVAERFARALS